MNDRIPVLAVTGATGFIGAAVTKAFLNRNWRVIALSRTAPVVTHERLTWRPYSLENEVSPELLRDVDALVHAAYIDAREGNAAMNIQASTQLAEAASAAGVGRRLFISSLAAGTGARSGYAEQKRLSERAFSGERDAVVRPGLVLGSGGLFARMRAHLQKGAPVPLIGGGRQPLQTVYVDDLVESIVRIVEEGHRGIFTLADAQPVFYERFYRELAAVLGVKVRFVPVPFWLAEMLASIGERLHLPLPVGRDNVLGLRSMVAQASAGDWQRLRLTPRPYRQGIELAASESESAH